MTSLETINLTFPGNVPSKKNCVRVTNRGTYYTKSYKTWAEKIALEVPVNQDKPLKKVECIIMRFWLKRQKKDPTKPRWNADFDNIMGTILDELVKLGYLEDDYVTVVPQMELVYEGLDDDGRCEVSIIT